jgi:predicted transcriptional regulator
MMQTPIFNTLKNTYYVVQNLPCQRGFCLKRNSFEIINDILILTKEKNLKTPILSGANMSYHQLEIYLDFLIDRCLLKSYEFNGKTFYKTTQKGFSFLESYLDIKTLLNTYASPTVWENYVKNQLCRGDFV